MNRNFGKIIMGGLSLVAVALIALLLMGAGASELGGGVVNQKYGTMVFASTSYTLSQTASTTGVDLGLFGAVDIQVKGVVTGTNYSFTMTPQFSNEGIGCALVTAWNDAYLQELYQTTTSIVASTVTTSTGVLTSTTTSTASSAAPAFTSIALAYSGAVVTGTNYIDNRELPTLGRCFRIKVQSNAPVFTPTVYYRAPNHQ